jgi:hypothetical protein
MITVWDELTSIIASAGPDPERAVFYPLDEQFLVERELSVRHYQVYGASGGRRARAHRRADAQVNKMTDPAGATIPRRAGRQTGHAPRRMYLPVPAGLVGVIVGSMISRTRQSSSPWAWCTHVGHPDMP